MTKKKKVWIIVLSIVGGVILLAALGFFLLNQLFSGGLEPHVVWFTEESPSGSFTLRVDKDQSPAWPFGSQGIYIYVEDELLVEKIGRASCPGKEMWLHYALKGRNRGIVTMRSLAKMERLLTRATLTQ